MLVTFKLFILDASQCHFVNWLALYFRVFFVFYPKEVFLDNKTNTLQHHISFMTDIWSQQLKMQTYTINDAFNNDALDQR